jgi:hypothetical protein
MTKYNKERYIRWANHRIAQLTFTINLYLGFSVASLAFCINLLLTTYKNNNDLKFTVFILSVSAIMGSLASLFRLFDFRYTALKIKNKTKINTFISKNVGALTWACLWAQILTYIYGAFFFISTFVFAASN